MVGILREKDFAGVDVLDVKAPIGAADFGRGENARDAIAEEGDIGASGGAVWRVALGGILRGDGSSKGGQRKGCCEKCAMKFFARHGFSEAIGSGIPIVSKLSFSWERVKQGELEE